MRSTIGLDIGSSTMKLIEITELSGQLRVTAMATIPSPKDSSIDNHNKNTKSIGEAVQQLLSLAKASSQQVVISIASSLAIIKTISIDASTPDYMMEDLVLHEAESHIPYSLDEVALDFFVDKSGEKSKEQVEVLLVACRNKHIEQLQVIIKSAGLHTKAIETDVHALHRAYVFANQTATQDYEHCYAVLDIGVSGIRLSVMSGDKLIYNRDQQLAMDFGTGQELKISATDLQLPPSPAQKYLEKSKSKEICKQISRAMQFYYSVNQENPVERIFLTGGIAVLSGVAEMIAGELTIPTEVMNPFTGMELDKSLNKDVLYHYAPTFNIACGLSIWRQMC